MAFSSRWRVLASSVIGTSHRKMGRGCDDVHDFLQLPAGPLLLAVADGAGSAKHAVDGARCAVQTALRAATDMLEQQAEPTEEEQWNELLRNMLKSVRIALGKLASGEHENDEDTSYDPLSQQPLREFATTLLFAIITSHWIAVTQIGDGAIVIQYINGTGKALTWPDHGRYANETSFVTDASYLDSAQYCVVPCSDVQGVALFTDGLERLALHFATKTSYQPFFAPLFKFATDLNATEADLAGFLASERICSHTDDDKTLVLAVCL